MHYLWRYDVRYVIILTIIIGVINLGCGDTPPSEIVTDPGTAESAETLQPVDSIGVLMGDSSYVLGAIADFTTLSGGRPAILDRVKGTVSVFDSTGAFLYGFGGFGEGPGEFQTPVMMEAFDSGFIAVIERRGKVSLFHENGEFMGSWGDGETLTVPMEIAALDDSLLALSTFRMEPGDDGYLIVYELNSHNVVTGEVVANYFRWQGDASPSTDFIPGYITITADGRGTLYLSRIGSDNWAVEVFSSGTEPADTISLFADRERDPAEGDYMVPGVLPLHYVFSENGSSEQYSVNMPGDHPFISQLGMDVEGNLWCRRGGLPGDVWDVVSPDGEFLREVHVSLPDSAYYIDMDVSPHGILAFDMFTQDYHKLYIME